MANYGNAAIFGDPRSPGWEDQNLVTVRAPNGQVWRVNKAAAPSFQGVLGDLIAAGYDPRSSGGFNYRNIRGGDQLSQHAFGNAIDINAATNALGSSQTDMPANIGDITAKYGLEWGGNWKNRPDPMHFEWTGQPGAPRVGGAGGGGADSGQLGQMFTGMSGGTTTAPEGNVMGQIAAQFLQNRQEQQKAQAEQQAAEQERKNALFAAPVAGGGGLGSLYG